MDAPVKVMIKLGKNMTGNYKLLKNRLEEAELVLIGIGEEWEVKADFFYENKRYTEAVKQYGEDSLLLPYLQRALINKEKQSGLKERMESYDYLSGLLSEKNYFIVSLCMDGLINNISLKEKRVVEPCGSFHKLQCADACSKDLYDVDETWEKDVEAFLFEGKEIELSKLPVCPGCKKPLVFNNIFTENYVEEGYLDKWQIYTRWLQGTVNKKVCIMELGVGMRFPSVIRWPFEKISYFNQKSSFFRIHSKLYHTAVEIQDRSYSIQALPDNFIRELSTED